MLNRRNISTPVYLVRETALRRNLDLIADVRRRAGVKIIMAFKANALWRTFHIMREYGIACTASSLNELRLGHEFLTHDVHSYTPAYTPETGNQLPALPGVSDRYCGGFLRRGDPDLYRRI